MQSWIDQAKEKLMEIIEQAKNDVANLNLRVAFVGWVFFFATVTHHDNPRSAFL